MKYVFFSEHIPAITSAFKKVLENKEYCSFNCSVRKSAYKKTLPVTVLDKLTDGMFIT